MLKRILPLVLASAFLWGDNQTATVSEVIQNGDLPFSLTLEGASFSLPSGIQAYASAIYKGKWIFLSGRTNGLHGFANEGNNFPPSLQNKVIYVIDPQNGTSSSRSMEEASSELSVTEIDDLSVTAAEFFQKGKTLYLVGGYGINTTSGTMETKDRLSAIDLEVLLEWVETGEKSLKSGLRQVSHPLLQVTGGALFQENDHTPFLLILGQNFQGLYTGSSNGIYTEQIRRFWLADRDGELYILPDVSSTLLTDYRRRDLNVVPIIRKNKPAYVAFAGVFTLSSGVWTVPIAIDASGSSFEPDPTLPETFKQAMNQYNCASFGLYSTKSEEMFVVLPGGISYGYFDGANFETDDEFPFINQVTAIKIDKRDVYTQYLIGEYPTILSTGSNPGNTLLFGAEAQFFPADGVKLFRNGVIQLDALPTGPVVIGYIAGGIMSTLPNTNTMSDSTASPYVFRVVLDRG